LTAEILSKRKVLVKFLDAVETLGATSCICSDKTGTLTMNKMTASNIWYSGKLCKADNKQKRGPNYQYEYDVKDSGFINFQEAAVVCSVANFDRSLPAEKINAVKNDESLKPHEKDQKIRDM
jgi:sodium/potassium-transporting ATPase subunit alpha